jgi:hypothetical protein
MAFTYAQHAVLSIKEEFGCCLQSGSHEHVSKFLCIRGIHPNNPQVVYTFWSVSIVVIGAVAATDVTAIAGSINKKRRLVIIVLGLVPPGGAAPGRGGEKP